MLKRLSLVSIAVALCAFTYTSDLVAAPVVVARASPVVISRPSYSPPPAKTFSSAPVRTVVSPTPKNTSLLRRANSTHRPVAITASSSRKKSKSKEDYDYYPLNDCKREKRIGFNGWKCVDKD